MAPPPAAAPPPPAAPEAPRPTRIEQLPRRPATSERTPGLPPPLLARPSQPSLSGIGAAIPATTPEEEQQRSPAAARNGSRAPEAPDGPRFAPYLPAPGAPAAAPPPPPPPARPEPRRPAGPEAAGAAVRETAPRTPLRAAPARPADVAPEPPAPAGKETPARANPAGPVTAAPPAEPPPLEVRRLRPEDLPAIAELADGDLPDGQPHCSREAVEMALRGESPVDSTWWQQLAGVQVVVAGRGERVVGAASYATAPADRSGWLLWLHAGEDRVVLEALLDRVLDELSSGSHVYAFWIATALTLGLEALPVGARPVTHAVLRERGLVGRASWRYLVAALSPATVDRGAEEVAAVTPVSAPGEVPTWRLTVGDPDHPLASAEVALGREGCGVLWWIEVEPGQRRRGIGRRLLLQSLRFLAHRGARTVAAYVDHDPALAAERRPALRLFASAGFEEVDQLWAYESPRRRRR